MLSSRQEAEVLAGAIQRGWLSEADLASLGSLSSGQQEPATYRYGQTLDRLLQAGRLREDAILDLIHQLRVTRSLAETCDPRGSDTEADRASSATGAVGDVVAINPQSSAVHAAAGAQAWVAATSAPLSAALSQWDRYEIVELLGRGGNGVVYKATDRRLSRTVALKFIHDIGAQAVQRLMREARAQARIDHNGVCKVYEVGELAGQLYISMEYLRGQSLQDAQQAMTLEEKVHVIKDVAEALHAAHQLGIIHRDIKPGNVMVSRRDDGGWKAVLMDFGLASDANASDRLTQSGSVMGTPVYMAPEQASGEVSRMDRRTDVYSLGAMFYELLVGEPPFDGATMVGILWAVMHKDPVPLRRRNASIPADLETITLKCLHKEMQLRYESAQALAEDLRRHLLGEPIIAKQASLGQRLRQAARKHRYVLALTTLAVLGIAVSAGIWVHGRIELGRQARLSQSFGQRIEIEMFLRYAYALPLHDTRKEKHVIRDRMRSIQEGLRRMDGEAAAMARYALGRGHFALKEYEAALEHLEAAHRGGLKTAEVEYALGRTLGEIYNAHFKDLQRRSGQRFLQEKAKIDKRYLEPALHHLRQPSGLGGESKAFAEALLAYYRQQYDEALRKADEALITEPWLYEPKKLQGDVYYAYGFAKQKRGLYDESRSDFHRAAALYHSAGEMARSDSATHGAEADAWVQVMEVDKTQGRSPKEALDRALSACDRAMAADPDNASALRKKTWAFIRWAEFQATHGEDPRPTAEQAIAAAQHAVRLNPKNAFPYDQIGNAYLLIAKAEHAQGRDSHGSEQRAREAFARSTEVNPMFSWAWNDFAVLHLTKAEWLAAQGTAHRDELLAGVQKLQRALDAEPDYYVAYSNLIDAYEQLARDELEHGRSPMSWIEKAKETGERSLQVNPNYYQTYRNLASIQALRAEFEVARGQSPRETAAAIEQALAHVEQATRANSDDGETHHLTAHIHFLAAREHVRAKADAREAIERGLLAITRSLRVRPNHAETYLVQQRLLLLLASSNPAPRSLIEQARHAALVACKLSPQSPSVHVGFAEVALASAAGGAKNQKSIEREISEGLASLERALALNPRLASALVLKGRLMLLRAQARGTQAAQRPTVRHAQDLFAQALAHNPLLQQELERHGIAPRTAAQQASPAPAVPTAE